MTLIVIYVVFEVESFQAWVEKGVENILRKKVISKLLKYGRSMKHRGGTRAESGCRIT